MGLILVLGCDASESCVTEREILERKPCKLYLIRLADRVCKGLLTQTPVGRGNTDAMTATERKLS